MARNRNRTAPLVSYDTFNRNLRTQEQQTSRDVLAFRDEHELRSNVERAGFIVTDVFGNWDKQPAVQQTPELIVIAVRS